MSDGRVQDLGKVLGHGSYGVVKLYHDFELDKDVAVKEIKVELEDPLREVTVLGSLLHDNIIELHWWRQVGTNFQIAMPYYPAGNLAQYIEKKTPSERLVQCWTRQLIDMLKFLRFKRVMHRDIKPSNILLADTESDEPIVVCDFGISRTFLSSASIARSFVGTILYMAPELFEQTDYSYSADLWSLGVTIYELLFKKKPFNSQDEICTSELSFPMSTSVSDKAKRFVSRILTKSPEQRPFLEELEYDPFLADNNDED